MTGNQYSVLIQWPPGAYQTLRRTCGRTFERASGWARTNRADLSAHVGRTFRSAVWLGPDMKRSLVQTGSSLAVTLPMEVVQAFGLKKGQEVDGSVDPAPGALVILPGA